MSNDGALDAAGEHRAGQVCPIFGIQRESLFSQLAAIDKQDSFVGDDIILGSPGGQCPVLVSSLGSDAAGQETMAAGIYSLQGGSGQQSIAAVQLHLYAGLKVNNHQINRHSIFQVAASMSNTSTLNATAWFSRQRSDRQHDGQH